MEALDNFVESNPHIVVSGMLDLNVGNYFFPPSLMILVCFSTVGLSETAETTAAGPGDVRIFQNT